MDAATILARFGTKTSCNECRCLRTDRRCRQRRHRKPAFPLVRERATQMRNWSRCLIAQNAPHLRIVAGARQGRSTSAATNRLRQSDSGNLSVRRCHRQDRDRGMGMDRLLSSHEWAERKEALTMGLRKPRSLPDPPGCNTDGVKAMAREQDAPDSQARQQARHKAPASSGAFLFMSTKRAAPAW